MVSEGEVWSLAEREDYFVKINKLIEDVIHVSILFFEEEIIMHLPISKSKVLESIGSLIRVEMIDTTEILNIIDDWQKDSGGVWDISINDILDEILGNR